jgi:hypothetical protein
MAASSSPIRRDKTTTTAPSLVPYAEADCFDNDYGMPISSVTTAKVPLMIDEYRGFEFHKPLFVSVEFSDGVCEIEHSGLGLYGRGDTCLEAMEDFLNYLISDYKEYAEESDENLDSHARALAERYRNLLGRL